LSQFSDETSLTDKPGGFCQGVCSKMDKEKAWFSMMTMEEFAVIEEKWTKIVVSKKEETDCVKDYVIYLKAEVEELVATQPKCWLLKEDYDKAFSEYKTRVEEVSHSNRRALKIVEDICHSKDKLANVQNVIETLRELAAKNREFWDDWQKNYFMKILGYLDSLRAGFSVLSNVRLEGHEELIEDLENNALILGEIVLPTHEWIPLEKRTFTFKPEWNPPEGSSMEPRKAEVREFVSRSICRHCSKQRDDSF
jgi:hypothetical protein